MMSSNSFFKAGPPAAASDCWLLSAIVLVFPCAIIVTIHFRGGRRKRTWEAYSRTRLARSRLIVGKGARFS